MWCGVMRGGFAVVWRGQCDVVLFFSPKADGPSTRASAKRTKPGTPNQATPKKKVTKAPTPAAQTAQLERNGKELISDSKTLKCQMEKMLET